MLGRQLDGLVHLVNDLLDVSRISRGKIELRKERVDLAALVRHALETSEPVVREYGHEVVVTLPEEPLFVEADRTRLPQALCNLVGNAAKYTEPGGRIELTAGREYGEAVIRVRDTGIGIPPEMLPRIFELFTQVDQSLEKSRGGMGIGLTIVKRLVELHGGSVTARSEGLGKGSEFIVRLPVAAGQEQPEGGEAPPAGPGGRRRVLVVDDNVDSAGSLATMLRLLGHEVRTAHDGVEAVESARAFRPELILLDIGMPRLNGYDTARRIRQEPWGKDAVLAALTGWNQEEDRRRSQEAGFNHHLAKPADFTALERLLAGLGDDPPVTR
jgi:CheY-like chemotaxis protein